MPAAVAIPLISTAVSAGTSLIQTAGANKRAKEAQKQIDNYQRDPLVNPYEGLQVSTLGADRQREDLARTMATYANTAAMGGVRGIGAIAPQLIAQQNAQEAQIVANLDQQEMQRQQMIAQGNAQIQQINRQSEDNDLLGLGNQLNVARQERANGINNLVQTGLAGASLVANMGANGMFDKETTYGKNGAITDQMMSNKGIYRQNGVGNITNLQPQVDWYAGQSSAGLNLGQGGIPAPNFIIPYKKFNF